MTAEKCKEKYYDYGKQIKPNSRLRQQLIIEYKYPQFRQSQLYGGSEEKYEAFSDLITIGKILNWTKIKIILVREIKVGYNYVINSIQYTYRVKSEGNWKLITGKVHGRIHEEDELENLN